MRGISFNKILFVSLLYSESTPNKLKGLPYCMCVFLSVLYNVKNIVSEVVRFEMFTFLETFMANNLFLRSPVVFRTSVTYNKSTLTM